MRLKKAQKHQPPAPPEQQRSCGKCGAHRVEVVGRSANPAMMYLGCRECGYMAAEPDEHGSEPMAEEPGELEIRRS